MVKLPKDKEYFPRGYLLSYAITEILKEKGWELKWEEMKTEDNKVIVKSKYKIKEGNYYEGFLEIISDEENMKIKFTMRRKEGIIRRLLGKDKYLFEFEERLGKFIDKSKRLKEKTLRNFINNFLAKLK